MLAANWKAGVSLVSFLTVAAGSPVQSQELASATQESEERSSDIVVTARNRTERLIDVPVAVSTVSTAQLERAGANDIEEISTLVPNLMVSKVASGTGASISVRGVGSSYTDGGIEQTVSINLDGFQGARGFITNVAFLDVAQVEVLKGPQALFFGKNSPAGVISLRSNDPGKDLFVSAKAGYEFEADEKYVEGVFSTPITDNLGVRVAARYGDTEGYFYNRARPLANPFEPTAPLPGAATGRVPAATSFTARATMKWAPTDRLRATFKLLGASYRSNGLARLFQPVYCVQNRTLPTVSAGGTLRVEDPYGDCAADRYLSSGDLPSQILPGFPGTRDGRLYSNLESYVATGDILYDAGPVTINAISGYTKSQLRSLGNHDQTVFARQVTFLTEDAELFSQEVRLNSNLDGPVNFSAGAFYETGTRSGISRTRGTAAPPVDPATGISYAFERVAYFDTEAFSVFAQLRWAITDTLELAGGARYTKERKDTTVFNTYVTPIQTSALKAPGVRLVNRFRGDNVSPEVTLSWKAAPDVTVYAAYKTGYKSGGASVPVSLTATSTADNIGFGPERSSGGEFGIKGFLFDRRLLFSSSVYRYSFEGLQLSSGFLLPSGIYTAVVKNAANARTEGAEIDATFKANNMLSVRAAVAYNRARLTSFPNAICYPGQAIAEGCLPGNIQNRTGQRLSRAPEWVVSGSPTVDLPLSDSVELNLAAGVKYTSAYATQDDGFPAALQKAFITVDASIGLTAKQGWGLSVIGRNLTNEYYVVTTNARSGALAGDLVGTLGRPREIALEASFKF